MHRGLKILTPCFFHKSSFSWFAAETVANLFSIIVELHVVLKRQKGFKSFDRLRAKLSRLIFVFCTRLEGSLAIIRPASIFNSCLLPVRLAALNFLAGLLPRKENFEKRGLLFEMCFFLDNVDLLCVVMKLIYEGDKIYSGLFIFSCVAQRRRRLRL